MRFSASEFEAAARQKRSATGESSRPLKRLRGREPDRAAAAPLAPKPAEETAGRNLGENVTRRLVGAGVEEGEIPATADAPVVVLDGEEATVATNAPEAERVTLAAGSPAATQPRRESAPLATSEGTRVAQEARDGAEATKKQRGEPGILSRDPAGRPNRPQVEGPQEGRTRPVPTIQKMADATLASCLLSGVRTAEFEEEMRGMSHSAILDMVMVSIVQMTNGAIGLREALAQSSNTLSKALARVDKYRKESQAHADGLAQLRQESAVREENLAGHLKEMESRAVAAEAKTELALERLKAAVAQSEELARRLRDAEEGARAAGEKAAVAEKAAAEATSERSGAVACADEAKARAAEAEAKAQEAEARAQQSESDAGQVLSKFRASPEFRQEVLDASLDAYLQGFEMCKARVAETLKVDAAELEEIRPGDSDKAPEKEGEEKVAPEKP